MLLFLTENENMEKALEHSIGYEKKPGFLFPVGYEKKLEYIFSWVHGNIEIKATANSKNLQITLGARFGTERD